MKNNIITMFTIVLLAFGVVNAQGLKAGAGISYGNEINNIGLRVDGVYSINKDFSIGATATYYLKKDNLSWFVVDANAQYNFVKQEDLTVYGLAGLNMTFWSWDFPENDYGIDLGGSGTDTGINIGTGVRKKIGNKLELFGEAKYVLSGAGFFSLGAGVLFAIN